MTSSSPRASSGQPGLLGQLCALCPREGGPSAPRHKMIKGLLRPQKPIHPAQRTKGHPLDSRQRKLTSWPLLLGGIQNPVEATASQVCSQEDLVHATYGVIGSRPGASMHVLQQRDTIPVSHPLSDCSEVYPWRVSTDWQPEYPEVSSSSSSSWLSWASGLFLSSLDPGFPAMTLNAAPITCISSLPFFL